MDLEAAKDLRRRLQIELDELRGGVRALKICYVGRLLNMEIRRLDGHIAIASTSLGDPAKQPEIKIPPDGLLLYTRSFVECRLFCPASVEIFISKIKAESVGILNFAEAFPVTFHFIEGVIDNLEKNLFERRDDNEKLKRCKDIRCSCSDL